MSYIWLCHKTVSLISLYIADVFEIDFWYSFSLLQSEMVVTTVIDSCVLPEVSSKLAKNFASHGFGSVWVLLRGLASPRRGAPGWSFQHIFGINIQRETYKNLKRFSMAVALSFFANEINNSSVHPQVGDTLDAADVYQTPSTKSKSVCRLFLNRVVSFAYSMIWRWLSLSYFFRWIVAFSAELFFAYSHIEKFNALHVDF